MSDLSDEIDENARAFHAKWSADINNNINILSADKCFIDSYRRLAALQALKAGLIVPNCSTDAAVFYAEAQNDALTSHVFASFGAWRSSLQSLRSCIENVFGALYFKDHPVEFLMWSKGNYRLAFATMHKYFCEHPELSTVPQSLSGLDVLKDEYATLSKAVHGSAKNFRMVDDSAQLLLWSKDPAKLGSWSTRHRKVIEGITLLTTCLYVEKLKGASHTQLRSVLGYSVSSSKRTQLRIHLQIHVDEPSE